MISEQAEAEFCLNKLLENVSGVRQSSDRINLRCPICGDSRKSKSTKRGWYYINSNSYYCWNSGCPASDKGMSGMQFISALTGEAYNDLRVEYLHWCNDNEIEGTEAADLYSSLASSAACINTSIDS